MNVASNVKAFGEKLHEIRENTADTLESAADSVRSAGTGISGFTSTASQKLESTAAFVRKTCVREKIVSSVLDGIRRKPMQSVAVAMVFGLVAGFSCRR